MSSALESEGVLGQSPVMHDLSRLVDRVANAKATLLIRGESGTGKELVARAIHQLSNRKDDAFVTVDCTNIPANLMESGLFGHERGAFPDARISKKGLLKIAAAGTVLLDEIGLMPLQIQAKMLNVLKRQRFHRVGGTTHHEQEDIYSEPSPSASNFIAADHRRHIAGRDDSADG